MPTVKQYKQKLKELENEVDSQGWRSTWRDLSEYNSPMRGRNLSGSSETETNEGTNKFQKIINGSAANALRTFAAGLQGGLASPSRPWFKMIHGDRELNAYAPVKEWLEIVEKEMLLTFTQSNFYTSNFSMLYELGLFGTGAMFMPEDGFGNLTYRPYTIGEYYIMLGPDYKPIGLYRDLYLTARQIVQKFGKKNVSQRILSLVDKDRSGGEKKIRIVHCIQPNTMFNPDRMDFRGMEYESVYFEYSNSDGGKDNFLGRGGYKSQPFVSPRFDVVGVDTYGVGPGMEALGDSKMLQKLEEKKLKGLDKSVDPPLTGPTALRNQKVTQVAGGITYLDITQGQQGLQPAYLVRPDLQSAGMEIERVEQRIQRFYYNDLFLSIISQGKRMTATEVAQRHDEKLIMLGPVIERLQAEALDPIVERMFESVVNSGRVPPPPQEIAGEELNIQYVSLLAQAQKIVGVSSLERTAEFVGNLAQIWPEAAMKYNAEEAVDIFAEAQGTPSGVIRSDEEMAEIKQQQQQAQEELAERERVAENLDNAQRVAQLPGPKGGSMLQEALEGTNDAEA